MRSTNPLDRRATDEVKIHSSCKSPKFATQALSDASISAKKTHFSVSSPLISELKNLWNIGVNTYDVSKKQNFKMRAALMWTISDFPAYSMLSGWSTAGRLACPYCMENSDAFTLTKGGKQSWFDSHRNVLPLNHPYRKDKSSFRKNIVVTMQPTPLPSGEDVLKEIEELGLKKVTKLGADIINRRISKFSVGRREAYSGIAILEYQSHSA